MQGEGEVKIFNRLLHPLPGSSPQHSYGVVGGRLGPLPHGTLPAPKHGQSVDSP